MQRLVEAAVVLTVALVHTYALKQTHTTVRSGGFDGTKDHNETKAQMTPSCDNPNCSYLPLSDNISNALKKSTYLIEQPLLICLC